MTNRDIAYIFFIFMALWVGLETGHRIKTNEFKAHGITLTRLHIPEPIINTPGVYQQMPKGADQR